VNGVGIKLTGAVELVQSEPLSSITTRQSITPTFARIEMTVTAITSLAEFQTIVR
jgi:hypothetical protein